MSLPQLNPVHFNHTVTKLRNFFKKKDFIEVHTQGYLSILSACEDPFTISTFNYAGKVWPLPQTGQMRLEAEMLKSTSAPGFFCVSTSYRNEPHPVVGRHNLIFPMFEFELRGGVKELLSLEIDLLSELEFPKVDNLYPSDKYENLCKKYGVDELKHEHERKLCEEYGPVFFITDFPERTSPFWNMKRNGKLANKIDVIIEGIETIGSAERSCNVEEMKHTFYTISDGEYAKKLFSDFGKERVEKELSEFLSYNFIQRSGGGIGMTRMMSAFDKLGMYNGI